MQTHRWDDWVPQERLRKLTEENKELASNLKKDMDAQRRAATGKPSISSTKKRAYGSDLTGSSARGSEDRSSAVPQAPRGTKRGREIEGIDKVSPLALLDLFATLGHALHWLLGWKTKFIFVRASTRVFSSLVLQRYGEDQATRQGIS